MKNRVSDVDLDDQVSGYSQEMFLGYETHIRQLQDIVKMKDRDYDVLCEEREKTEQILKG